MNKLAILSLAATALVPASALAQTVAPPERWQDVPPARLNVPAQPAPHANPVPATPPPGVTWQRPATPPMPVRPAMPPAAAKSPPPAPAKMTPLPKPAPVPAPIAQAPAPRPAAPARMAPAPAPMAQAPAARHSAPMMQPPAHGNRSDTQVAGHGSRHFEHRGPDMHRSRNFQRIGRGHAVPNFWWSPGFHVQNWGLYGFPQPYRDQRWIRYYDDALLIDGRGMVHDERYGMDWDRYGEPWEYDREGIPAYVGDGDYEPYEEDYGYAEGHGDRYAEEDHHPRDYEQDGGVYAGYGPGAGYGDPGCGCVYVSGGMITETTTTTTAPTVTEYTYYVDEAPAAPRRRTKRLRR